MILTPVENGSWNLKKKKKIFFQSYCSICPMATIVLSLMVLANSYNTFTPSNMPMTSPSHLFLGWNFFPKHALL